MNTAELNRFVYIPCLPCPISSTLSSPLSLFSSLISPSSLFLLLSRPVDFPSYSLPFLFLISHLSPPPSRAHTYYTRTHHHSHTYASPLTHVRITTHTRTHHHSHTYASPLTHVRITTHTHPHFPHTHIPSSPPTPHPHINTQVGHTLSGGILLLQAKSDTVVDNDASDSFFNNLKPSCKALSTFRTIKNSHHDLLFGKEEVFGELIEEINYFLLP